MFAFILNYEHSPNANNGSTRQISDDRHIANYSKSNTTEATAKLGLEYLTEKEVDRLIEAARKRGRNGQRDAAAILLAYRHGLRAAELCALRWA